MIEYQPLEAPKVPKMGQKWTFEIFLLFRVARTDRHVKTGQKIGVHANFEKSQAKNGRDPCTGNPIYSLLKIRSIELFRSGLP